MGERKALLILHGKQALNEDVRAAVVAKREEGWDLAVRLTWEGGDAARLVDEALAAGYTQVIAGGGDGTLRDIAEALEDSRLELVGKSGASQVVQEIVHESITIGLRLCTNRTSDIADKTNGH